MVNYVTDVLYYDLTSHYCILLCWVPPWRWPKKAKTCRRATQSLYNIVSNFSAVVLVPTMTCFSARNMDNFKFAW